MSEKTEKLYDGITGIRDDIVEWSEGYVFHKKSRNYRSIVTFGTMAACACLMVLITLPYFAGGGSHSEGVYMTEGVKENQPVDRVEAPAQAVEDTESMLQPPMESAVAGSRGDYMCLFPSVIPYGYEAERVGGVYESTVFQAKYYNEELQDEMIIRIASKEWFAKEVGDVEFNCVFYQEKLDAIGSYIYIDGGEYIAEYSFSTRDIAEIDGFYDMVYSAPFFGD